MKNIKKLTLAFIFCLISMIVVPQSLNCTKVEAAKKPTISNKSMTLTVSQQKKLTVKNYSSAIKWSTNKKNVATVSKKGIVTAKKPGTATITATVGKTKLNCKVTVKAKEPAKQPEKQENAEKIEETKAPLEIQMVKESNPSTNLVLFILKNTGDSSIRVHSDGAWLWDFDYPSFNRKVQLINRSAQSIDFVDIPAHGSETIIFYTPIATYYSSSMTVSFTVTYNNVKYSIGACADFGIYSNEKY